MYYALIDHDGTEWRSEGLDDFEFLDFEKGDDGPALDRVKRRAFHAVQELNDGKTIIVKWVYTNRAHALYRRLLNEHVVRRPQSAAAKLLADAGVTGNDDPD